MGFASVKGKRKLEQEQETGRETCEELNREPDKDSDGNLDGEAGLEQDRTRELWYIAQVRIGSEESIRR